jgi:hypothetical protein
LARGQTPDSYGVIGDWRLRLAIIFPPMDFQYDAAREALAAMNLAAEAHGAERPRWINATLAWIELTRLRATGRDRVNDGALGSASGCTKGGLGHT